MPYNYIHSQEALTSAMKRHCLQTIQNQHQQHQLTVALLLQANTVSGLKVSPSIIPGFAAPMGIINQLMNNNLVGNNLVASSPPLHHLGCTRFKKC